jgi:hypothetical protein
VPGLLLTRPPLAAPIIVTFGLIKSVSLIDIEFVEFSEGITDVDGEFSRTPFEIDELIWG